MSKVVKREQPVCVTGMAKAVNISSSFPSFDVSINVISGYTITQYFEPMEAVQGEDQRMYFELENGVYQFNTSDYIEILGHQTAGWTRPVDELLYSGIQVVTPIYEFGHMGAITGVITVLYRTARIEVGAPVCNLYYLEKSVEDDVY